MLHAAWRDLLYRRRRIVVAVVGASLVLGLGLVMSGFAASFGNEATRTVNVLSVPRWAVPSGAPGPFSSVSPVGQAEALAAVESGRSGGVLFASTNVGTAEDPVDAFVIGVEPGQPGAPPEVEVGRTLETPGEAVVSTRFGYDVGGEIAVDGQPLAIVGKVDATLLAGSPLVIMTLADAQRLAANGLPLVTSVALDGDATVAAPLRPMSADDARDDAVRPLAEAEQTIAFVRSLLWLVAALIVGSVLYLNALERTSDVAVFKAMGVSGRSIIAGMFFQAAVIALAASALAVTIGLVLAPVFPLRVEIPGSDVLALPLVALGVSFLGALAGVRRAASISPALAFGGA